MAEFVINPRRAPRAPVRCRAEVTAGPARWTAETEDVGPRGCQIVSPSKLSRGQELELALSVEGLSRTLHVGGRIAWISASEPWRLGVCFAERDGALAVDWYDALVAKNPSLAAYRGVPDRISLDATLFLGPPPKLVLDFTPDELRILRCIGSGLSVRDLRARLEGSWHAAQHALFSLIVRRHVVLARGASVLATAWTQVIAGLEASLPPEELARITAEPPPRPAPTPAPLPPTVRPAPPAPPPPPASPPAAPPVAFRASPPPAPHHVPPTARPEADDADPWGRHEPRRDFKGAGVGWRSQPRPRSPEADRMVREATLEAEAGKVDVAIGLLRQALHLAPGDPEIAALLGKLAFRDRTAPDR